MNKEADTKLKEDEHLEEEDTFVKPEPVDEDNICFKYNDKEKVDLNKVYNQRLEKFINEDQEEEKPKVKKVSRNNMVEEEDDESEEEEITPGYSLEFCDKVKKEKNFDTDSENETEDEDNEEVLIKNLIF